ncbi:MAG TPA: stage II sporulation protein P, partial [Symbiobacteriaceae bacterium]|nr:stage II sporulation protein P [Symbiobacteriaceae bacterium]
MIATKRIWAAKPFLVAYVVAIGFTMGLLIDRVPHGGDSVPTLAGEHGAETAEHAEVKEPPLWLQLFRPSQPTARMLLRWGLPVLTLADGTAQEEQNRNLVMYWSGKQGDKPQTFFQTMLPFLRSGGPTVVDRTPTPAPPDTSVTPPPPTGTGVPGAGGTAQPEPQKPGNRPQEVNGGLPLIGIYHTHNWESYISEFPALKLNNKDDLFKVSAENPGPNVHTVVNLGNTLAVKLQDLGVTTIHAPFKHSALGYDFAYNMSRTTARQILTEAPTVKVLIDLHRDGAWGVDSTTMIDGKKVAPIRCIIGKSQEPHWQQNKAFCDTLMQRMEQKHPGLTQPTMVKDYTYNQDLIPGAILLEIGNALNQYAEADRATTYLAE